MNKILLTGTILAALVAPGSAFADTFLATSVSDFGIGVQINAPQSIDALAGEVTFTGPGGTAEVWCMDLLDFLFVPYLFQIAPAELFSLPKPGVPATLTQAELDTIKNIVFLGDGAVDGGGSQGLAAEYQVAIWQTEYQGAFSYSASAGFVAGVNGIIAASDGGTPLYSNTTGFLWLSDAVEAPNQTMIELVDGERGGGVPEPSTWAMSLIGFSLLGLAGLGKRRLAAY